MTFKYASVISEGIYSARFEVLTAVWLRIQVVGDVTMCLWVSGLTVELLKWKAPRFFETWEQLTKRNSVMSQKT
jgi:hypothetical protein